MISAAEEVFPLQEPRRKAQEVIQPAFWRRREEILSQGSQRSDKLYILPKPSWEGLSSQATRRALARTIQGWRSGQELSQQAKQVKMLQKAKRQQRVEDLLDKAAGHDSRNESHEYHKVLKQLFPWQPRQYVQLKSEQGAILDFQQEQQLLRQSSEDTFGWTDILSVQSRQLAASITPQKSGEAPKHDQNRQSFQHGERGPQSSRRRSLKT